MDLKAFGSAIAQIAEEKGLPQEKILEAVELALAAAYKRDYALRGENIRVSLDPKTGKMRVFKVFLVVDASMLKPEEEVAEREEMAGTSEQRGKPSSRQAARQGKSLAPTGSVSAAASPDTPAGSQLPDTADGEAAVEDTRIRFNPERHMMITDAKKIKSDVKAGDELLIELEPHDEFGRIAAQTAKQVIVQRIREIERDAIAQEYTDKVGEIISGIVQRVDGRTAYVDLGRGVGVLFPQEQIPGEFVRLGARIRALLLEVNMTPRGPQIILSRAHPDFVKKLFEMEVPEIAAGIVEIKAIAREAGSRTKIAVASNQARVDPIGACVGQRGTRVLTVINELNGEKIDVIEWSADTERFIANALAPAKVTSVELHERATATVKVPEEQLSLAIGREGQNVRLAVKLTNWKIDIEGAENFLEEAVATAEMAATQEAAEGKEFSLQEPLDSDGEQDVIRVTSDGETIAKAGESSALKEIIEEGLTKGEVEKSEKKTRPTKPTKGSAEKERKEPAQKRSRKEKEKELSADQQSAQSGDEEKRGPPSRKASAAPRIRSAAEAAAADRDIGKEEVETE